MVRVGFALFPHVVRSGFAEVQPPYRHLGYLLWGKVKPGERDGRMAMWLLTTNVFRLLYINFLTVYLLQRN